MITAVQEQCAPTVPSQNQPLGFVQASRVRSWSELPGVKWVNGNKRQDCSQAASRKPDNAGCGSREGARNLCQGSCAPRATELPRAWHFSAFDRTVLRAQDGEVMACAYVPRSQRGTVPQEDCVG